MNHGSSRTAPPEARQETQDQDQEAKEVTIEELTVKLHQKLGETLLEQIEEGKASSGVLAAAIKWLKDQNMVINMSSQDLPSDSNGPSLLKDLPFHDEVFKVS